MPQPGPAETQVCIVKHGLRNSTDLGCTSPTAVSAKPISGHVIRQSWVFTAKTVKASQSWLAGSSLTVTLHINKSGWLRVGLNIDSEAFGHMYAYT